VKPQVMFFSSGLNQNMCCLISLKVPLWSMKLIRVLPCCARINRSLRAWNFVVGSSLLSRMRKILGMSSWMVKPQKPRRLNRFVLLRIFAVSH